MQPINVLTILLRHLKKSDIYRGLLTSKSPHVLLLKMNSTFKRFNTQWAFNFDPIIKTILWMMVLSFSTYLMFVPMKGAQKRTLQYVCELVREKFYKNDESLQFWVKECFATVDQLHVGLSKDQFLEITQNLLHQLKTSHLMIYSPSQDQKLWKGEALETGMEGHLVYGSWLVKTIIPGGPAEKAGIKVGFEILSINSSTDFSGYSIQTVPGLYEVLTPDGLQTFQVQLGRVQVDQLPQVKTLSPSHGYLKISSFRSEYFSFETWTETVRQLQPFETLTIDVRGNSGGNVVAMLRALSPFMCEATVVGRLIQPRRSFEFGPALHDNLDDRAQIAMLERYQAVPLKTFSNYGCYRGKVKILMNSQTSSVSEMFVSAFRKRGQSCLFGETTAGHVVMASWFPLKGMGNGFTISIPESLFLDAFGDSLEGIGVQPEENLEWNLEFEKQGVDTWLSATSAAVCK